MTNERSMRGYSVGMFEFAMLLCGVVGGISVAGCGPGIDVSFDETREIDSVDQALQPGPGGPGTAFRWAGKMAGPTNEFNHSLDPAACGVENLGIALVSRDAATQRYLVYGLNRQTKPNSWGSYGTRTFGTRPACVRFREDPDGGAGGYPYAEFVIAGRGAGNDRRLFTSLARWTLTPSSNPEPATPNTVWTPVGTQTYQNNGSPALATNGFDIVLVFLGDDSRLYLHKKDNPYDANNWAPRIQGPALPSGWTAQGTPAVAFTHGTTGKYQIIVRARNSFGTNRLYQVYFYIDRFTDWAGNPNPTFSQVNVGSNAIDSDPAFAWDWSVPTATLYFRSGGNIIQTSGLGSELGTLPKSPIAEFNGNGLMLTGSPGAQGGSGLDHGRNLVVARSSTDNQLYACESEAGVIP
jgi:hypothetical protein